MWQEIIITDLTQMSGDRVCIAGIDHKGNNIRPNLPPPGIYHRHLYQKKQVIIRPRAVVRTQPPSPTRPTRSWALSPSHP